MATYDLPRAQIMDGLEASIGSYLASQIQAAIDVGAAARGAASIVTDFVPGDVVPAGTDIVIVKAGEAGAVSVPSHVGAIIFTGPAGVQVALNVEASIAVQLTEGADVVTVTALAEGQGQPVVSLDLGAGNDVFVGARDARNYVVGGMGDDRMTGGARNDRFDVGQGSDTVDAGAGYDQAFVHGSIDDYSSAINDDGSLSLTNTASGEVTRLKDLEFLTFEDGAVMLNVTTEAGFAAASLYEVVLGRGADPTVHEHYAGTDHASLIEAANGLLGSLEFSSKFGPVSDLTDAGFLEILYAVAFEREADQGGLHFWLERLASGASRGEVAVQFASSAEAHAEFAATIHIIDKGHTG